MKIPYNLRPLFLVYVLAYSFLPSCQTAQVAQFELPYDMPARAQPLADKAHQYIDWSWDSFAPIVPFIGEIARTLALTVTNPKLLRLLHGIELVADTLDISASAGMAGTNRRDIDMQPNAFSRLTMGVHVYLNAEEISTAAQLTYHAGDLAAYKKSVAPAYKKFLQKVSG